MLLQHEEYQSSLDKAIACMVECEHCAEACMGNPEMKKCDRMYLDTAEGSYISNSIPTTFYHILSNRTLNGDLNYKVESINLSDRFATRR